MPDLKKWIIELRKDIWKRRNEVCEVVSDVSDELYLNALTATSLRCHGRGRDGAPFWVRSEWRKHDLRYGRCRYFGHSSWNKAWLQDACGHMGHIESKLIYTHHVRNQLATLQAQLEDRWNHDRAMKRRGQAYHGLIWAFHHGDGTDDTEAKHQLERIGAKMLHDAKKLVDVEGGFVRVFRVDLGRNFWPTCPERYVGHLWLRFVELKAR